MDCSHITACSDPVSFGSTVVPVTGSTVPPAAEYTCPSWYESTGVRPLPTTFTLVVIESSRVVDQNVGDAVTHTFAGTVVEPDGRVVLSVDGQSRSYGTSGQLGAVVAFRLLAAQSAAVNVEEV